MAFNGTGTFVRLRNWVNDAAAAIKIRADYHDSEDDGFAAGLSNCICKDGQTTITANLPMAGFKHTGVADGSARNHYASVGQSQDGLINWVAAGGTADAITASYAIPLTALIDGQLCFVRAGAANATTTPTFAPSGLTAHTITKLGGSALAAGDISAAGHELILRYKLASTRWELLNPAVTVSNSSTSVAGIIQTATTAQAQAGTDTANAVTSQGLALSKSQALQNSQSTAYTTVLADAGKHILHPAADTNDRTFTIDSNANVAYPIGTMISFVNEVNTVTIAITSDTLILAGPGTTGSRTLAANGMATAIKTGTTKWVISGSGLS